MTRSRLWREFESGDGRLLRLLRRTVLIAGLVLLGFTATIVLDWKRQLMLAGITLAAALWMNRRSTSHLTTLTLVLLSAYSTGRYAFWRVWAAMTIGSDPGTHWDWLDWFFIAVLLLAEGYAFVVLMLGYLQVLWPLHRAPVPLPESPEEWPDVDLLIPTLDEPLSLVRSTALAAINIDWPPDKLHVYLLDDGGRNEFRRFAEEAGIGYLARDGKDHAKAGNLNHALGQIRSPFVAVFDCDQVPTRSFLQLTMGWMLRDAKLAVLQTPQQFYSPDPFERNLEQFRVVPNENELYYGVVQDGNDLWNATCFCGSGAVLRRAALDEVGGIAVETLTEDAHTSLRMQMQGWNTAYINIPQAAGLATESLSSYVKQRVRWARGMIQTLRLENPLLVPGLSAGQRLCYLNAMLHFLYALPRLVFLTAPMICLMFGRVSIPGFWAAILAYAAPHLALSRLAHGRIYREYRHSFWNEIYETALAPYLLMPTLLALFGRGPGKFEITPKGNVVEGEYFDREIARPFLFLIGLNVLGLVCGVLRLVKIPELAVPSSFGFVNWPGHLYHAGEVGFVALNVVWVLFNLLILGVATAVARESRQRRQSVRVAVSVPSDIVLADGSMIQGVTSDLSAGGVRTQVDPSARVRIGDSVCFVVPVLDGAASLPATVVRFAEGELRAQFTEINLQEEEALTTLLYSRADAWLDLAGGCEPGGMWASLRRVAKLSWRGLRLSVGVGAKKRQESFTSGMVALVLIGAALGSMGRSAWAAQVEGTGAAQHVPAKATSAAVGATAGTGFDSSFTLREAGAPQSIVLHGTESLTSVHFGIAQTQSVATAALKLRYQFSPGLLPTVSQLIVDVNGEPVATLPVTAGQQGPLEAQMAIPVGIFRRENVLTLKLVGHYAMRCEDPLNSTLWVQIDSRSSIELQGTRIPISRDLDELPAPFFDAGVNPHPVVQIAFLSQPTPKMMQAGGVVASWLGAHYEDRPVRFVVSVGSIPQGDVIVIAGGDSPVPAALREGLPDGAAVAMRVNPSDPISTVLLVKGDTPDEALTAARALALQGESWRGAQVGIGDFALPPARRPDDAPRWMSTDQDRMLRLGDMASSGAQLQGSGEEPLHVKLRLPPDLDYGDRQNLGLHLDYRYNSVPVADGSVLQVSMNGRYISSTPMSHADRASRVLETVVPVPVSSLRPFMNDLEFRFLFRAQGAGNCEAAETAGMQGSILGDSFLNVSGVSHSAVLPNLRLFANSGFPFTRRADLSETSVILPERPTAGEMELFLALMGRFGAETGYPVTRVEVTDAAGMDANSKRDYLVIGNAGDMAALSSLNSVLPVDVSPSGVRIRNLDGILSRLGWLKGTASGGRLETSGGVPDLTMEEAEWPAGSDRTVVVMVLRDEEAATEVIQQLPEPGEESAIDGSVSILRGGHFRSYWMAASSYRVGGNSWVEKATRMLQRLPWMIAVMAALFCFVIAALLQARLRRRAQARLGGRNDG